MALVLALLWGSLWAVFLQIVHLGRYLVRRRTWVTVVAGIGIDLVILLFVVPFDVWLVVVAVIAVSSLPIISRALAGEDLTIEAQALYQEFMQAAVEANGEE